VAESRTMRGSTVHFIQAVRKIKLTTEGLVMMMSSKYKRP